VLGEEFRSKLSDSDEGDDGMGPVVHEYSGYTNIRHDNQDKRVKYNKDKSQK
jgi:hypothetical protein